MKIPFRIVPFTTATEELATITALYEAAFPISERRETDKWQQMLLQASPVEAYVCMNDKQCCGFITLWDFRKFVYVEHFAIQPTLRGAGIGGDMLDEIRQRFPGRPFVLEVEAPEDEMACRRIGFYGRHGFHLLDKPYIHPPYRPGASWFSMCLMATDPAYADEHFTEIRDTLHHHVYGVATPSDSPKAGNK